MEGPRTMVVYCSLWINNQMGMNGCISHPQCPCLTTSISKPTPSTMQVATESNPVLIPSVTLVGQFIASNQRGTYKISCTQAPMDRLGNPSSKIQPPIASTEQEQHTIKTSTTMPNWIAKRRLAMALTMLTTEMTTPTRQL